MGTFNANDTDPFADLLGEGGAANPAAAAPGGGPTDAATVNAWNRANKATQPRDLLDKDNAKANSDPTLAMDAFSRGNIGGATGGYNTVSDAGRDAYDYYRDIRDPGSVKNFLNKMGEDVGVSRAGDAAIGTAGDTFRIGTPFNALDRVGDPDKGLGTTAGRSGAPVTSLTPGTRAAADLLHGATPNSPGDLLSAGVGGVRDALDDALGGAGGGIPVDASGADRGGMGLNGAYSVQMDRAYGLGDSARQLGADVLSGAVAGPNAADAQRQGDALSKIDAFAPKASADAAKSAAKFASGPKAASDVLGQVSAFAQGPEGPSSASLLQDEASQKAMSDVLSVSRSGRARDAGSQARAANMAQAEIAGMGVDNARNAALLRNKEANDARGQQLQALGLSGDLAQGLDSTQLGALSLQGDLAKSRDSSALQALGLGGDLASQMRGQGISERGQGLDFMQGQQQIGAGLESDVLGMIPQLEQIRHDDQFEMTPQQKIAAAKLGGPPDKTTTDYVAGLLGDVLGVL